MKKIEGTHFMTEERQSSSTTQKEKEWVTDSWVDVPMMRAPTEPFSVLPLQNSFPIKIKK
jgi:hypothetical protein